VRDNAPSYKAGFILCAPWGLRPRKAASRSLEPASGGTLTGAANSGRRSVPGTSIEAIARRSAARSGGMGWQCPHARDMSHPWTAISRAPAPAIAPGARRPSAMWMTSCWRPGSAQASRSRSARSRNAGQGHWRRRRLRLAGTGRCTRRRCPRRSRPGTSLACRSSIRRSHPRHGVGRDRNSGVTAAAAARAYLIAGLSSRIPPVAPPLVARVIGLATRSHPDLRPAPRPGPRRRAGPAAGRTSRAGPGP
jgi:hypothetical protein